MRRLISIIIIFHLFGCGCARLQTAQNAPAERHLPSITAGMETPDFWIGRVLDPDKTVLSAEEIARFNDSITRRGSTVDVAGLENIDGARLRSEISAPWKTLSGLKLYFSDSTPVNRGFWSRLQALMALRSIPEKVRVLHAFVALRAEQRALPSDAVVTVKPGDIAFDEMQNSSLDIWAPVAVAHESADGKWVYAIGVSSSGWLKKSNVAFCGREQMTAILKRPFAVVTAPKATVHGERVRMGVILPLSGHGDPSGDFAGILFPVRDSRGGLRESEGSLPRESVSVGFLPYTQRTILVQAFKLLGAPYGWGGSGGEQDCSSFLQEIFSTVGIRLPRNSSEQAKAGSAVDLPSAVPAITILGMKGHIMLYLGEYEDNPYAIHAVWAYREPGPSGDIIRKIGRVAVTPLSLGEGSKKGSWQKRINSIKTLK